MDNEEQFMRRALELAERGRGFVEPNPLVGAVIVRDGAVVGEGFHERFGAPHAEIGAIATAGSAAHGATLFVTLEPCCHTGKTPPCTDAIRAAGLMRVVAATIDPFERVSGQGVARLRSAGIAVEVGMLEREARQVNAPFIRRVTSGRPYVHAKWAMTLDGKIATACGDSKWITGPVARRRAHELRGRMDAIIIGIGTALADDPLLTARPPGPRIALRVVLDSQARLPLTSHLVRTANDIPVLVVSTERAAPERLAALRQAGCECMLLAAAETTGVVQQLLQELGRRDCTNVFVEGGGTVLGAFLDAGQIDEIHAFLAPKLIGGLSAHAAIAGNGLTRIADAAQYHIVEITPLGDDVQIRAQRRDS